MGDTGGGGVEVPCCDTAAVSCAPSRCVCCSATVVETEGRGGGVVSMACGSPSHKEDEAATVSKAVSPSFPFGNVVTAGEESLS